MQTGTVDTLYEFLRVVAVMVVYDAAHTDVRTVPQGLCEGQHSVSAFSPVVVFHFSAVHRPYTATGFYMIGGVYHSVVQCYEDRGWLEHRTWLQKVAHGMVVDFSVFAVETFLHVYDGLDVARWYIHHDGYTHIGVDFLQLVDE